MVEKRYAVVRDGIVENVVLWDGESDWASPDGASLVLDGGQVASPGDTWDGDGFTRAVPVAAEPDEPEKTPLAQLREALLADPNLAPKTKAAIQQIAGGGENGGTIPPLTPKG